MTKQRVTLEIAALSVGKQCVAPRPCMHCDRLAAVCRAAQLVVDAARAFNEDVFFDGDYLRAATTNYLPLEAALAALDKAERGGA